ncbi:MAG: methylmalonyl Co-A mutase-associated GTPase MeaB [Anaerolineales bacterium]|nr:methylmalonyl Co-A mutase-associated GTPase MeaB [Anaerolineales bacterium]
MAAAVRAGERRALARLLTQVENGTPTAQAALAALYPFTGGAWIIGLTGPPGSGKSSLVNALARQLRQGAPERPAVSVAIVAVDPSSPFTGGAILGDRIRMRDLAGDPGVFIRSLASRGSLGGLARATADIVRVLDAAGYDVILIETVGAGQSEVEIARTAHTTIVIEAPGLGDDVQAIKAGLLEAADILVVNKADQPGADAALKALRAALNLAHPAARRWAAADAYAGAQPGPRAPAEPGAPPTGLWRTPLLATVAPEGKGLDELLAALDAHRAYLQASGELERRQREQLAHELTARLRDQLLAALLAQVGPEALAAALDQVAARVCDPGAAAWALAEQWRAARAPGAGGGAPSGEQSG